MLADTGSFGLATSFTMARRGSVSVDGSGLTGVRGIGIFQRIPLGFCQHKSRMLRTAGHHRVSLVVSKKRYGLCTS